MMTMTEKVIAAGGLFAYARQTGMIGATGTVR